MRETAGRVRPSSCCSLPSIFQALSAATSNQLSESCNFDLVFVYKVSKLIIVANGRRNLRLRIGPHIGRLLSCDQIHLLPARGTIPTTWSKAAFGKTDATYDITVSGRDIYTPNDDWAALYQTAAISTNGVVTVYVQSIDPTNPWTKSGIAVRNSLQNGGGFGYAALFATPSQGIPLSWENSSTGLLNEYVVAGGVSAPVYLRLNINGTSVVGSYSQDQLDWINLGAATLTGRNNTLDTGILHSSQAGFLNSTALFSNFTVT
jgi:hypothetical protein